MDLRKLKTLIDLVAESNIAELEITEGEGKVRIVKSSPSPAPMAAHPMAYAPAPVVGMPAAAAMPQPSGPAAPASPSATGSEGIGGIDSSAANALSSPMVGTFYRASSPGGEPFVSVGDNVTVGQTLCVIEAMKLMNEVPSDRAGVVKEILVENGQAVEFGQALFVIA
ncbi:MAG: acetyl-CoA carboxylase biotin carboxyl carrier protein [Betaproteobacteria bacterium]|jgi:acetyl-CoA carboxylase biotin carboxyl carrier protein|nr:acetyl-CoA carboxylase biotin carboxyl carrier protein [Betaproteobacteria bacterium]